MVKNFNNREFNLFHEQTGESAISCNGEDIQNPLVLDDTLSIQPVFDIRTQTIQYSDCEFDRLEYEIHEKPKGVFSWHRREPSTDLSVDQLNEVFGEWTLVSRKNKRKLGEVPAFVSFQKYHTVITDDGERHEFLKEKIKDPKLDSKRQNVKEVRARTRKHKNSAMKDKIVPHADKERKRDDTESIVSDSESTDSDISLQKQMIQDFDGDSDKLLDSFPLTASQTEVPEGITQVLEMMPKNLPENSLTERWMHHLENMCIYTYQMCRAETLLDCFVATLAYIKMNFDRSVCSFAADLVKSIMDMNNVNSQHTFQMKTVVARWETLKANTVFGKIKYLISAAMTLPVLSMKKIEFNPFGFQLMQIEAMKASVNATDVIDAILKTFSWIADTGSEIIATGSLEPILYEDSKMMAFNQEIDWLTANGAFAIAGNFPQDIPNACHDIHEFETRLDKCLKQVIELKQVRTDGPTAPWIQARYEKLMIMKQQVIAKHQNTNIREAPIGFALIGHTGVGKSTLAQLTMKTSLNAMGYGYDQKKILTKDMFDKYDSTYTSDVLGLFMDDVGNSKPDFAERAPTDVIIKFFNNVAAQAVKAELNAKGVVFVNFKCGVVTSNIQDLGARHYSDCPESILRRFFHVDVAVQPQYRLRGGVSLDASHPELVGAPLTKDVWKLTILEIITSETSTGTMYTRVPISYRQRDGTMKKAVDLTLIEYLTAVVWLSEEHHKNQINVVKRVKDFEEITMCECCKLPVAVCSVAGDKNIPHSEELAKYGASLLNQFVRESVGKFFQGFIPGGSFLTWFGYKPISKMLTSELASNLQYDMYRGVTPRLLAIVPDYILNTRSMQRYLAWWTMKATKWDFRWHLRFLNVCSAAAVGVTGYRIHKGERFETILTPLAIAGTAHMLCHTEMRCRARMEREAFLQRRDAIVCSVKGKYNTSELATMGIAMLGLGLKVFHNWYTAAKDVPHAGEPNDSSPGWMGYYIQKFGFNVHPQPVMKTAVSTDIVQSLSKRNLFWAEFVRKDGSRTACNIFFPQKCVALFPQHVWYPRADMSLDPTESLTVNVIRSGTCGGKFSFVVDRNSCVRPPDMDITCAYVPNCPDIRNVTKWFPEKHPTGRVIADIVVCDNVLHEGKPNTFQAERVEVTLCEVTHASEDSSFETSFRGGKYKTSLARVGACMGCLVSVTKSPVLIGFHMGGNETGSGVMQTVAMNDYERMMALLENLPCVVISSNSGPLPLVQYNKSVLVNDRVHPSCMAAKMTEKHCVELYGSTQLRTVQRSTVIPSVLSPHVAFVCGVPNIWGPPKLQPNWKGFNATLEHIANPPLMFEPSLLRRAWEDWLQPLEEIIDSERIRFSPLTFQQSIMGIPGKRFIDPLPMDTGMGFPVFGPKKRWFEDIWENGVLVNRVPNEEVVNEYNRMLTLWKANERAYPVCSATLKDEPTKVTSEKVRVFQAAPVALSLHIRKYYLPIVRFLCANPIVSECAVGLNAFAQEWDALMERAFEYDSDCGVLAWDYSKYDVRMSSQVTRAVLAAYIRLAERAGYGQEDLDIMKAMVNDIVHPLIDYNGVLLMAFNMNTSGNNITVNINSTAGSLYVRMGLFDAVPEVEDFRDTLACMTYGDDFVGSLRKEYHDRFNFEVYQKFLARHNMKITLPDKGDSSSAFMDVEDVDFLKRKSNFIPELNLNIGKLDENSIFKSLHANLKSKTESPSQVAASCVAHALHEWFAYGRDHYEMRREQMRTVCQMANLPLSELDFSFDDRVAHWRSKYHQSSGEQSTFI